MHLSNTGIKSYPQRNILRYLLSPFFKRTPVWQVVRRHFQLRKILFEKVDGIDWVLDSVERWRELDVGDEWELWSLLLGL